MVRDSFPGTTRSAAHACEECHGAFGVASHEYACQRFYGIHQRGGPHAAGAGPRNGRGVPDPAIAVCPALCRRALGADGASTNDLSSEMAYVGPDVHNLRYG